MNQQHHPHAAGAAAFPSDNGPGYPEDAEPTSAESASGVIYGVLRWA